VASPIQITVKQLARLIGTPAAPALVDVRIDDDFNDDPQLIPGAFRHPFKEVSSLASRLHGQRAVVYCQKGLKLSEGAAAVLRSTGVQAEVLEGGQFGWRDASQMMLENASVPSTNENGQTVWVTRLRPKIDRVACPWLIRRFVDPNAQFLFVASSEVEAVAEKFGATAFDIENVFFSHREEQCTFDSMLAEFGLNNEALQRVATIVRGADTDKLELAPQSAGLLAASLGLSRMYTDDLEQLNAGMLIYDALYRWARDATDEGHDWPSSTPQK